MAAAVQGVESGTVMWSVLAATQDTNDADREPNFGSFRGTVMFTPSRSSVRRLLPTPITIFLDVVQGEVGDDGILRDLSGLPGVVLVSPWATGIEETGWTWEASFALNQREKVSFSFDFMPDEVVDLTRETPVLSSPGIVMTKGDKGDAATVAVGTVATGAPGSSATVANGGTSAAAVLNFSIPRGDVGATPILAGTSATSFAIGTGSKIFATQAGMALQVGQYVRIVSRANGANYMAGDITAYSTTNLTVNVTEVGGSGTFTDWNINLTGVKGATGQTGAIPAISGTSATSFTPGTGSKVFTTQAGIQGFTVGQYVRIASASVPGDYMAGQITAYTTTSLTVNVVESAGATARTDWNISLTGTRGATGTAATVAPGTVTTGAPGSSAAVTNTGTSSAAVFAFTIPRGDVGATPVIAGTSATSFIPSVGSKVFTTQAGMSLAVGQYVRIASASVPGDFMAGVITAYSGTSLTVTVDAFAPATGGVARTDWNISITGTTGAQGPTGAGAPDATAAAKGSVQLAGDLGGTAAAPTVPTKVSKAGDTMTGPLTIVDMNGMLVPSQNNKFYTPDKLNPLQDPFPSMWHDVLAFFKHFPTPIEETSADGATAWTSTTLTKQLFARKENQSLSALTSAIRGRRWTWQGGNLPYATVAWLVIGFAYDGASVSRRVLLESSVDGTTWTTRHDSTHNTTAAPAWHSVADWGGDTYLRLSLIAPVAGNVRLSTIRMLSARWGDQGGGSEVEIPYTWDENQVVTFVTARSSTAPAGVSDLTRKDYTDARDQWTPTLKTGATYTFALTDETNHILSNDTVAQTYTIPTNATAAFPLGTKIQVTRWNTGTLTLAAAGGVTLNSVNANRVLAQYESCMLVKVATDSWLIVDLATAATTSVQGMVALADNATAVTGTDATKAITPASGKAQIDANLANVPIVIMHDGTTVANRPATTRAVHWIVPATFAVPLTGTTAGGTKAAVNNLDLISRY